LFRKYFYHFIKWALYGDHCTFPFPLYRGRKSTVIFPFLHSREDDVDRISKVGSEKGPEERAERIKLAIMRDEDK